MTATPSRPKPGDKVREIGWACPGSDNAKLFGYSSTGCYVVRHGGCGRVRWRLWRAADTPPPF